ncbi:uroporphyrinogen-III synthase [Kaistia geumhonensis]|uniref:Uroporphyrinogen-III synthase n=1 Tax=Kaistia geumhonensis TaxID=410839 RepID=A0ABU0M833_9HYPH|nr:uroporphyrinogen-III synthase [Kaistia geumhonensis]MCX5477675.1 uroporphyrinogen-III synthase [Kaistia geumhonensis]MDQ0517116.1 uroporphyrinogen-III synthase [Kaistia geumhonensis]
MRLLVTRPQPEAERTAAELVRRGHEPVLAPLLVTEFLPAPAFTAPAALLFTSANGVRAVDAWPGERVSRAIPALCVGARTAAAARVAGFTDVRSADGDGDDLARLVLATLDPAAGPLLHPTVARPARDLAVLLGGGGFTVETVEAYRMSEVEALPDAVETALRSGAIDGVLLYSRRTAETFARLTQGLRPHLAAMPVYCLSADVAAGAGGGRMLVAAAPNEAALLALVGNGTSAAGIH